MKWKKYTIETVTAAEDILAATLAELGIQGVEIQDAQPLTAEEEEQMFVDIPLPAGEDDGSAHVSFYLEPEEDCEAVLAQVRQALEELREFMEIGSGEITESETADKDWINNWKEYFKQFSVDRVTIVPSWEEPEEEKEGQILLHMDPGTAFGTGMHETTQLCMKQLLKHTEKGMRVLDVGTGSGILAILALKLGAAEAAGTDLDSCAVSAVRENKEANQVPEELFELKIGNLISDTELQEALGPGSYDLVTANILAEVLLDMTGPAARMLKKGGWYICSGILAEKVPMVREAIEAAGLQVTEVTQQGEWAAITARK